LTELLSVQLNCNGLLFNLGLSSAHGIALKDQEHWPSETSFQQLLVHDQPRINRRSYRPVV